MKKIFDEFKQFAIKGNVVDMAIGIMIGSAFNKIVSSLVEDIIMPPIGYLSGGMRFDHYKWILKPAVLDESGKTIHQALSVNYGHFLQVFFDFFIIAFSMFLAVKIMNKLRSRYEKNHKKAEKTEEMIKEEVLLLREIRDELKKRKN